MIDDECIGRAAELGSLLASRRWRIATAESCTGGLVAGAITAIAGSSEWFEYGFVAYANRAKTAMLAVPESLLIDHGAVSEPVACAMAERALSRSGAEVAVAVTGIAGPGGGSPTKPVGLVCFAWAVRGEATTAQTRRFAADRAGVRRASVLAALDGAIARVRASARH